MSKQVSMRHKRREAPQWVFPWRSPRQSPLPKIAAVLITLGVFAFLLVFVRIRVNTPNPWIGKKASLFRVLDDTEGRALTLRAREGGPFPSRFQPMELEWVREMERTALGAARWQAPPYEPALRPLPDSAPPPLRLSSPSRPVLPHRQAAIRTLAAPAVRVAPVLYPLSGLTMADLPEQLPEFAAEVPPAMAAESWRFLLRLDAAGQVRDVVPFASGGADAGQAELVSWLRLLVIQPSRTADTERWVAVGLGFVNQPRDGTVTD